MIGLADFVLQSRHQPDVFPALDSKCVPGSEMILRAALMDGAGAYRGILLIIVGTKFRSGHEPTTQSGGTVSSLHTMSTRTYYIGVDIGTGSARAALVKQDGALIASSAQDTPTWRDDGDHRIFEQSTTATWAAICNAIKEVVAESKVDPSDVKGLGFDATCSLAVTDMTGNPICVTGGENLGLEGDRNVILWADHRAEKEAELITSTGSGVLDYVGGVMSVSGILLVCG